ncbi:SusC/RagA family TonB-linked outer membrane protein [Emticicia oligotrophica]|uniref:SusC/RagA family TonB-linked outer membrane protein n=1 Tax=Emticicia oligotrophica TaxID=312279 RepID=UPI00273B4894|nr:SusC/RagA family TonB-linked outer membrane protein [Emticicia oligotrophica]
MKHRLILSLLGIFASLAVLAQGKKITGKVTSSDGTTLPGVTVKVKETSKGTQTDIDGNYMIDAVSDNTLVFSFVGMNSKEIKVGNQSIINMTLDTDTKQLSEIVVTAIGIQREKKAIAYAISNVKAEDLQQRSEPDALRALTGKVPGVNVVAGGGAPGQSTRITIRGNTSFSGNNQPLFVVDGIPFDNSVNATDGFNQNTVTSNRAYDIDPNNIESLTILKGAAASALYGSRAANGVVVITTKSGSKSAKKGLEVNFNSSYSFEQISTIPDYQNTYTQGFEQTYSNGSIGNWGTVFPSEVTRVNQSLGFVRYYDVIESGYPAGFVSHPLAGSYGSSQNYPSIFPQIVDGRGNPVGVPLVPHDIIGGFFRTGNVIENSINISSTGDKTTISAGASRMTNEGIVPNSGANRTTLNFGGNATLVNKLNLNGNVNYVNTNQSSPQSGAGFFSDYTAGLGTGSIYSRLFYMPRNYDLNSFPFENPVTGENVFYRGDADNPLWTAKYNVYNSNVNRVFGNLALNYDVTPWLNLTAKGGVNTYSEVRRDVYRPGGNLVPLGQVNRRDITNTEIDFTFLASANRDINEKINMRLLVGFNANQRYRNFSSVLGQKVIDPNLLVITGTDAQTASEYRERRNLYGFFAEYGASYNNYAFITATVRNDYSSTLPSTNNSYLYPSVSGSFIFTDAFDLPKSVLSFGKLRASYAKVGKDADPYSVFTTYNFNVQYFNGKPVPAISLPSSLNNTTLKPEFTAEVEVGTELQFFKNRIGLDVAFFNRNSTDLIVQATIPSSSGFGSKQTNAGKINNKGIEIGLNLVPIKLKNGFTWNSFVAFTQLRSKVIDAGTSGELFLGGTGLSSLGTMHRNGFPFGMIYGSRIARDDEGNYLINPTTGLTIINQVSEILANPAPKFTVGWTNTFSYKAFTLTALMDYRHGGSMFSSTAASLLLRGQLTSSEDREGLRVIPGVLGDPETQKPILDETGKKIKNTIPLSAFQYHFANGFGAYGADETNIYDITTIRLREVSMGYNVPKPLLKKILPFFGTLRISASGRNLWFYAPNMLKGLNFDPEVLSDFADSNVQGFDLGASPSTRRFSINLSASF